MLVCSMISFWCTAKCCSTDMTWLGQLLLPPSFPHGPSQRRAGRFGFENQRIHRCFSKYTGVRTLCLKWFLTPHMFLASLWSEIGEYRLLQEICGGSWWSQSGACSNTPGSSESNQGFVFLREKSPVLWQTGQIHGQEISCGGWEHRGPVQ